MLFLIMLSAVLFNHLGLADQMIKTDKNVIVNCSKCFTFWAVLLYVLFTKQEVITAIGMAFLFSYLALWMQLLFEYLNLLYEKLYGKVEEGRGQNP